MYFCFITQVSPDADFKLEFNIMVKKKILNKRFKEFLAFKMSENNV